jgi:hypothetical protein
MWIKLGEVFVGACPCGRPLSTHKNKARKGAKARRKGWGLLVVVWPPCSSSYPQAILWLQSKDALASGLWPQFPNIIREERKTGIVITGISRPTTKTKCIAANNKIINLKFVQKVNKIRKILSEFHSFLV